MTIDTQTAGYAQAVARVREITGSLPATAPTTTAAAPTTAGQFADELSSAMSGPSAIGRATSATGGTRGQRIADIATAELGVAEQPPGSNDGPRIAQYRSATAGAGVGPWCAYFTSWVAAQAGAPLGPDGRGLGYVPTVKSWAEQTGRYIPAGAGQAQVGDLVIFDRKGTGVPDHIGVVTGVSADGGIQTVEGNSSDRVSARTYGPGGYVGLVRPAP